eukprot:768728-Hanusia_phi.AAC.11
MSYRFLSLTLPQTAEQSSSKLQTRNTNPAHQQVDKDSFADFQEARQVPLDLYLLQPRTEQHFHKTKKTSRQDLKELLQAQDKPEAAEVPGPYPP